MIGPLQRFVEELRASGVTVSPPEAIDAARAAAAVGPEDRARFRAALAMTLAKDRRSLDRFEETFERFFASPARGGAGGGRGKRDASGRAGGGAGGRGSGGSGTPPPSPPGEDPETAPSRRPSRPARAPRREGTPRRGLRALPPDQVQAELRKAQSADASRTGRPSDPRARRETRKTSDRKMGRPGASERAERPPRTRLSRLLGSEESGPPSAATGPRRRDLAAPMTPADERELAREIPRLVEEIRLRHSRRMRRAPRGRLFMKRAIRENLATGGVPFRIPMRVPRRKRPRVVLVVDVSWSVATASGLFLLLAMEFLRSDRRARIYFFVDHPVDATDAVRAWLGRPAGPPPHRERAARASDGITTPAPAPSWSSAPLHPGTQRPARGARSAGRRGTAAGVLAPLGGRSFGEIVGEIPGLDPNAASDYGRAFWSLAEGPLRVLGRDAVLVVLGDARTNRFDPLPWAFEQIASRARRVLWLAPERRALWGTGDSALPRYLPFCDVAVEARDIEGLAHGVREMVGSL